MSEKSSRSNWYYGIIVALAALFFVLVYFFDVRSLILGGVILILSGLANRDLFVPFRSILISGGVLAIITHFIPGLGLELYLLCGLFLLFVNFYLIQMHTPKDNPLFLSVLAIVCTILVVPTVNTLQAIFSTLNNPDIVVSVYLYLSLILYFAFMFFLILSWIFNLWLLAQMISNRILKKSLPIQLSQGSLTSLAILAILVLGGYSYLAVSGHHLKDFIILIALIFLTGVILARSIKYVGENRR